MTSFQRFFASADASANAGNDPDVHYFTGVQMLEYIKTRMNKSPDIAPEPDPSPLAPPIDGVALLDEVAQAAHSHLVLQDCDAKKIALYVAHTHALAAAQCSPRLVVIGPTIGCGKTTALRILSRLTPRPLLISDISAAGLYRATETAKPTVLIDEVDAKVLGNPAFRRLLNGGFNRDGALVARGCGVFDSFSPVILATISELPESLRDRSIVIPIKRKLPQEKVAPLDAAALTHLAALNEKLATFAAERGGELAAANPIMPDAVTNRLADKWQPLLAIADAAGGHWPQTARSLAIQAATEEEAARSPGELALSDVRSVFAERQADRLASECLVESLWDLEDRPWASFIRGRPITPQRLAQLLKPFGIGPRTIRFKDYTAKGYYLEDFTDAFERYL